MIERLCDLAERAGRKARAEFGSLGAGDVFHKGAVDMVTRVDHELEEFLRLELEQAFPEIGFLGEEGDYGRVSDYERVFVVDPLDGTTSFVHGHPFYSISIALVEEGQPVAGVVCLPQFHQSYWALRGAGAFRDGSPIHVSETSQLINALAATGFACVRARLEKNNLPLFCEAMPLIRGIRRCGSAAIDLCYVADGRYDLYWEFNLQPWDVAAGMLIVAEAGGRVTDLRGGGDPMGDREVLASNGLLHESFLDIAKVHACR